ncbi:asparaginase [Micromonospora inositola]|uniref:asparaginase n=1 Tax=Micromonospora inositola TaxID=47865 RepID=A0A1C5JN17_9ACTN|nr:asparaginase [Micromonospora inositola]SCG71873.1 asparaginase [Micromonospora inositola]
MRIAVLATGGTIASRLDADGDLAVTDTVAELLAGLPLPAGVEVVGFDLSHQPSFTLTLDDMLATVRQVRAKLAEGFSGVVVTHGTDTLEETAYLTGQLTRRDARIVLTGAQRGADEPDSDARRNLTDALQVVATSEPVGVAIVLGGLACAAVEGRKVHTSAISAFSGGSAGTLALVDPEGVLRLSTAVRGGYYATLPLPDRLPRVDLVKLVAGADGTHLRASLDAGAAGIVVEAFGIGNAPPAVADAVREAQKQGVPVAITSRTGAGRVRPIYAGGGADLARAGAIFAGDLTGPQARVALALTLAHEPPGCVPEALRGMAEGRHA